MKLENIVVNTLVFDEYLKKGVPQHELISKISTLGIRKVEVRKEYIKNEEEFGLIQEAAENFGMELFYSIPELLFEDKMIENCKMKALFEEAKEIGASYIKMTGGYAKEITQKNVDFINRLIEEYEIKGFTVENDQVATYSTGDKLLQLVRILKNKGADVSITFDIGNFVYVQEDPLENAKKMSDMVSVIHLKDVKQNSLETTLLGHGDIPIQSVLNCLPKDLNVVIEYPCGIHPLNVLKQELNKLLDKERV
ncbi:sugar phosphate isomerase/epimerase [Desemzia sp. RIT804]|uniref:sugar phosphate isomerase/epimerase family protein n=1 Tax=Desemzia sp. RIT 804 TaxID=2810209 RepID=UPI00194EBBAD|nr:TIM barrel protein [Desemzia sp. RIT 804]MBM6615179.1 sugar phosphate isomerase/epimerase [Desemzia sp. RIT 804]